MSTPKIGCSSALLNNRNKLGKTVVSSFVIATVWLFSTPVFAQFFGSEYLPDLKPYAELASASSLCGDLMTTTSDHLSDDDVARIIGPGNQKQRFQNVLVYLMGLPSQTQYQLVVQWERFALKLISMSLGLWDAYRFVGEDGAIGYQGMFQNILIFDPHGHIYTGTLPTTKDHRSGRIWKPDYSTLRRLN